MTRLLSLLSALFVSLLFSCHSNEKSVRNDNRMPVIFDTDANNELDDQHALAYLLFNTPIFNVIGVTVNATSSGGNIDKHYEEAKRVMMLTNADNKVPLLKGANGSFTAIQSNVTEQTFDGSEGVNFIINEAKKTTVKKLILLAVGKLTNVALALKKDSTIADNIKVVWLGSNYPLPGEYNQDNDTVSMNYLLNHYVPFEIVTVRYGQPTGSAAVTATKSEIEQKMRGLGPSLDKPIEGRHGGLFHNFGDYSVNLFEQIPYHDENETRALFDMVAVAILKNEQWGNRRDIPAPILIDNEWVERPDNKRVITIWENFDKEKIMEDFYDVMENFVLVQ
jgi:purine nucleosidase